MLFLFVLTFLFWIAAMVDLENDCENADLERKYWHHLDPALVAEGTFAVATIMAFFKLMFLCQLNRHLGPLQVSLGKMTADIAKYVVVYTIIMLAFSAGLSKLYQYYDGMIQVNEESGIKTQQASSFVSFDNTLKTLFWALFCMSPIESADVVIENLPGNMENTTIINEHTFTEAVGYIAFAVFEVVSVIIILNMLIATMSNTFQRVNDNVEIELTFGRTEVYVDYISQTTLPSPFNLLPTADGMGVVFEWMRVKLAGDKGKTASCTASNCCYLTLEEDEKISKNFPHLMAQLVQRYFREREAEVLPEVHTSQLLEQQVEELREQVHNLQAMMQQVVDKLTQI